MKWDKDMSFIPRFIVDEMNGNIAKWLRIIGFDCIYLTGEDLDDELLEIADADDRILLTGDRELFRKAIRRGIEALYTSGDNLLDKLRGIFSELRLERYVDKLDYRCPLCNQILIKKKSDETDLPENIKKNNPVVYYCSNCNKYYWKGSHWKNIMKVYRELGVDLRY